MSLPAPILAADLPDLGFAPIGVLILLAMIIGLSMLIASHVIPKRARRGPVKDSPYESGMEPIGDARRRFNVRFYLVAMLFLLFDVELIFMYPWAMVFTNESATAAAGVDTTFLFNEMLIFFVILLVGYAYAWRKGIFQWD